MMPMQVESLLKQRNCKEFSCPFYNPFFSRTVLYRSHGLNF